MPRLRATNLKRVGKLTRSDLMERWGVSNGPLIRMVKEGTLREEKIDGVWYYSLTEVEIIEQTELRPKAYTRRRTKSVGRPRKPNDRSASWVVSEAFRMFRDNANMVDVAIALHLTPSQVDALYAEYKDDDLDRRARARSSLLRQSAARPSCPRPCTCRRE
jgi:hypothetical protein